MGQFSKMSWSIGSPSMDAFQMTSLGSVLLRTQGCHRQLHLQILLDATTCSHGRRQSGC